MAIHTTNECRQRGRSWLGGTDLIQKICRRVRTKNWSSWQPMLQAKVRCSAFGRPRSFLATVCGRSSQSSVPWTATDGEVPAEWCATTMWNAFGRGDSRSWTYNWLGRMTKTPTYDVVAWDNVGAPVRGPILHVLVQAEIHNKVFWFIIYR